MCNLFCSNLLLKYCMCLWRWRAGGLAEALDVRVGIPHWTTSPFKAGHAWVMVSPYYQCKCTLLQHTWDGFAGDGWSLRLKTNMGLSGVSLCHSTETVAFLCSPPFLWPSEPKAASSLGSLVPNTDFPLYHWTNNNNDLLVLETVPILPRLAWKGEEGLPAHWKKLCAKTITMTASGHQRLCQQMLW